MNIYRVINPGISWVMVLILPLYSLPWVIYRMCHLGKHAFVQFAFFMGLVGILYPPTGDLYRYYENYVLYQGLNWNSFLLYSLVEFDYFLSFLLYFLSSVELPCDLSRFIFNFLGFYIMGKLYLHILNNHRMQKSKTFRIRSLIIFFVFSFAAFLYRSSLASALFVYGAYFVIYEKKKKYWLFIGFSIIIHFSYILFAILLILSKKVPIVIRGKGWYILILLLFLYGVFNIGVLFNVEGFTGAIFERYKGYMDTDDAGIMAEGLSWKNMLWQRFSYFVTIIMLVYFVTFRKSSDKSEWSFINYLLFICIISSPFSVIFNRFVVPLGVMLKIYLLKNHDNLKLKNKYVDIIFLMTIVLDGLNIWAVRRELYVSDMSQLFSQTSFQILNHQYADSWINRNVGEGGSVSFFE